MRVLKISVAVMATFALCFGSAFADGGATFEKDWSLEDITSIGAGPRNDDIEVEPNDTCPGQAYACGDKLTGAVRPAGDVDWYTITLAPDQLLTIGTEAAGIGSDTVIELFAADCVTSVAFDDDGGPGLFSLIEDFNSGPGGGTFHLKVIEFGNNGEVDYFLISSCRDVFVPGFCPIGEYKASKVNVDLEIPDGTGEFIESQIKFNPQPGFIITDVVIDLDMEHTWVGDLIIILKKYDDAGNLIAQTDLVNRPGVPDIGPAGCSGNMIHDPENKYYFSDRPDLEGLGFPTCTAELPGLCYGSVGSMDVFRGLPKGEGHWQLCISDNVGFDVGYVHNWSVHLLCEAPISVEESTWAKIKAEYK